MEVAALLQGGIVSGTGFRKLGRQSFLLASGGIDAVTARLLHLRGFLGFDGGARRAFAHVAHGARIIGPASQRWQPGSHGIQGSGFVEYNRGDADHEEVIGGGLWNGWGELGRSPG
jgi:hypothetical protein